MKRGGGGLTAEIFEITGGMVSRWTHQQEYIRTHAKGEARRGKRTKQRSRKPQQLRSRKAQYAAMGDLLFDKIKQQRTRGGAQVTRSVLGPNWSASYRLIARTAESHFSSH